MNRKNELEAIIQQARVELRAIEEQEMSDALIASIGKCGKFQNNYSCPSSPSDYWWMYVKVIGVESLGLRTWEFEKDSRGEYKISFSEKKPSFDMFMEITEEEFLSAWQSFMAEMNNKALAEQVVAPEQNRPA